MILSVLSKDRLAVSTGDDVVVLYWVRRTANGLLQVQCLKDPTDTENHLRATSQIAAAATQAAESLRGRSQETE